MALVKIDWKPGPGELRKFGIAMLVGFGLVGILFYFGLFPAREPHPGVGLGCWIFGAVCGLLGLTGTKAALPVYWGWMGVALVVGTALSFILLAVVYYGLFT